MEIREIDETEVDKLYACIAELSAYHNEISVNFKGIYPSHDYRDTLAGFKRQLSSGNSRIAVTGDDVIRGFCKIDLNKPAGKLDYLMVSEKERGKGYGRALMEWAMKGFQDAHVSAIEVKVVDGNPAIHLYEKYGFRMNAHILRREV